MPSLYSPQNTPSPPIPNDSSHLHDNKMKSLLDITQLLTPGNKAILALIWEKALSWQKD
jgi:hypothetical protein